LVKEGEGCSEYELSRSGRNGDVSPEPEKGEYEKAGMSQHVSDKAKMNKRQNNERSCRFALVTVAIEPGRKKEANNEVEVNVAVALVLTVIDGAWRALTYYRQTRLSLLPAFFHHQRKSSSLNCRITIRSLQHDDGMLPQMRSLQIRSMTPAT